MPTVTIRQAMHAAAQLQESGRLVEAETIFRQVLAAQPDNADALHLLGLNAFQRGDIKTAAELTGRAATIAPAIAAYHTSHGTALAELTRHPEAIAAFRQAIALDPQLAEAHNNLGNSLRAAGQTREAIAAFQAALQLRPEAAQIHYNLGNAFQDAGRLTSAIDSFEQALRLNPDYPEARNNLAYAQRELGRPDDAAENLRRAIELRGDYAEAYTNFGNVMKDVGLLDKAIGAFKTALAMKNDLAAVESNLIYALHFHPAYDAAAIAEAEEQWRLRCAEPLKVEIQPREIPRGGDRRLRIGYVSPDFYDHVVGRNVLALLKHHDRAQVEVFCYSSVARPDAMTAKFKPLADHWRDAAMLSDAQLAERVREDQIDILVDLTLHMDGNRLLTFARKPAPLQFSFAGYPGGTGLDTIDYRLSDAHLDPPHVTESFYREKTLLIESFWCFDPAEEILGVSPPVNAPPSASGQPFTFGCLNNFCKVTDEALELWSRIMRQAANSRLMLLCPQGSARQRVWEIFAAAGIAERRLQFVSRLPRPQYLALHNQIDLMLDTFPYNGHSTTLDALWMGAPVVTLASEAAMPAVGRGGKSILSNLNLKEFIAERPEAYVKIAAECAGDRPRLSQLRRKLRSRMQSSILMNSAEFARQIEAAYRAAWATATT